MLRRRPGTKAEICVVLYQPTTVVISDFSMYFLLPTARWSFYDIQILALPTMNLLLLCQ